MTAPGKAEKSRILQTGWVGVFSLGLLSLWVHRSMCAAPLLLPPKNVMSFKVSD